MEPAAPGTNRPYGPPSNVTLILQRLRSRNMPDQVDNEYLRDAGIPDGTINRTMFGLVFLGLVEDDGPTPALIAISTATDEEYRAILSGLVREAYREVFEVLDPAQDDQGRILNFFRRYTPGSQRSRMVMFFLAMCREAGIPTLDAPRQRVPSAARPTPRPAAPTPQRRRDSAPNHSTQRNDRLGQTDGPFFGITQDDIGVLDEETFAEVWTAIGKVVRAKAQRRNESAITVSSDGRDADDA